jgi:hypothetical protein
MTSRFKSLGGRPVYEGKLFTVLELRRRGA